MSNVWTLRWCDMFLTRLILSTSGFYVISSWNVIPMVSKKVQPYCSSNSLRRNQQQQLWRHRWRPSIGARSEFFWLRRLRRWKTYPQIINYRSRTYNTDENVTDNECKLTMFIKPPNKTPSQYAEKMVAKALRCRNVFEEQDLYDLAFHATRETAIEITRWKTRWTTGIDKQSSRCEIADPMNWWEKTGTRGKRDYVIRHKFTPFRTGVWDQLKYIGCKSRIIEDTFVILRSILIPLELTDIDQ